MSFFQFRNGVRRLIVVTLQRLHCDFQKWVARSLMKLSWLIRPKSAFDQSFRRKDRIVEGCFPRTVCFYASQLMDGMTNQKNQIPGIVLPRCIFGSSDSFCVTRHYINYIIWPMAVSKSMNRYYHPSVLACSVAHLLVLLPNASIRLFQNTRSAVCYRSRVASYFTDDNT